MRRFSRWIASPCRVTPPSTIFSPLYSGGLWLPVISTPEPVPSRWVAKYSIGVATMPMSTTPTPAERMPSTSASRSFGPDRRPSRPTAISITPPAAASAPSAAPISRTASTVSVPSTTPRMS